MARVLEHHPPANAAALAVLASQEMARVRAAQPAWGASPLDARLRVIRGFRHLLAERAGEIARTAAGPDGRERTLAEVLSAEVIPLADACRFLERQASRLLAPRRLGRAGRPLWLSGVDAEVRREPLGVVLVLAPSNYPLFLPGAQALQALAAGNAVLWKPGRGGRRAAQAVVRLLVEAGLDERLVRVLPESAAAGRAALEAGPDKVVLTGSVATGTEVLTRAAELLVPVAAELSGCDALFILPGAGPGHLDRAAASLCFGLTLNGGATCIAPRRVLVPLELGPALEERLAALVPGLPAVPLDAATRSLARGLVADALDEGARLLPGTELPGAGESGPFPPLVVLDTSPAMELLREDLFAPVAAVVSVIGERDALGVAEQCPYALGASIFGPEEEARKLAGRVRAGSVTVNDAIVPTADPRLPFGGRDASGFGVTRGAEGLLEMTAVKTIAVRRGRWLPHLEERQPEDGELLRGYLTAAYGRGARQRFAGGAALLRALVDRTRRMRRERRPAGPGIRSSREETA
jgi:acyl-CoA reductase-like NAD-dependent aldehyde dehydrogenase